MNGTKPPPTIPRCHRCGKQAVLYAGICKACKRIEDRQEQEARRG